MKSALGLLGRSSVTGARRRSVLAQGQHLVDKKPDEPLGTWLRALLATTTSSWEADDSSRVMRVSSRLLRYCAFRLLNNEELSLRFDRRDKPDNH